MTYICAKLILMVDGNHKMEEMRERFLLRILFVT